MKKINMEYKSDDKLEELDTINASQLVKKDDWLEDMFKNMERRIVNDEETKRLLYKIYCSRFCLEKPLNALLREEYSAGKSFIANEVAKYMPPKRGDWKGVQVIEGMTKKFMYYIDDEKDKETGEHVVDLSNRIWLFTDIKDHEEIRMLRSMMSHDKLERLSSLRVSVGYSCY